MERRQTPGNSQLFIITNKGDISYLGRSRDDSLNSSDSEYAASSEADDGRTRRHKVGWRLGCTSVQCTLYRVQGHLFTVDYTVDT